MVRKATAGKILVLGVDGMDPRLTRKYVDEGKMPNTKKIIDTGAQRHDLVMLGGHPTITPPMWTTLATGCYANVHGITCFDRKGDDIATTTYNIDSRFCKAEQLWNVFAESGKRTLVWHWPGSAWPPSSDSPNLYVVDGTSPGSVTVGIAEVEQEFVLGANETLTEPKFIPKAATRAVDACIVTDLEIEEESGAGERQKPRPGLSMSRLILEREDGSGGFNKKFDMAQSYIKPATDWAKAPNDAKEFVLLLSGGKIRRVGQIWKNEKGIYDKIAIFKNKKAEEPIVVLEIGVMKGQIIDEAINKKDEKFTVNRNMKLLELAEDGSKLKMWISAAMNIHSESVFHPHRLYDEIVEACGYPTPTARVGSHDPQLVTDCMLAAWDICGDWQAKAMQTVIEKENIEVVFSHYHNVDLQDHNFIRYMTDKGYNQGPEEMYCQFMEDIYEQTDRYIGKFLHLLDEGWTIFIVSDHAQVCSAHDFQMIGDCIGINIGVMEELGLTTLKRDSKGKRLYEIDWEKTVAVAQRSNHIYVNLKGRDPHGIVDPKDKYEVEEEIMTKLYSYKDKKTGHRIISVALRNKDAVLLGMGGPESGDIIYWVAEGYCWDHGDSLSTTWGEKGTSVSPIFIAAGSGLKKGFETDRIIREVDLVPTMAVIGGVKMPAQCEGAPVYQILDEEY
jgi:Uncharacterized conserved protein